ncbi:MAG: hypothetical protein ACO3A2_08155 [Bdellovibrionia bacterium]
MRLWIRFTRVAILWFCLGELAVGSSAAFGLVPRVETSEVDFQVRSRGVFEVTNSKGDIQVHGWALDKIRLKIKKQVLEEDSKKAQKMMESLGYRYSEKSGGIELSSRYGGGFEIEKGAHEALKRQVRIDLEIMAPSYLALKLWATQGKVEVRNWNASVDLRMNSGSVILSEVKGSQLQIQCARCSSSLKKIQASVRYSGGEGDFNLEEASGKIYVETQAAHQKLSRVEGEQLYISTRGKIFGEQLEGKVEFSTEESSVELFDLKGWVSGKSHSGNVMIRVRQWKPTEPAWIETNQGNIVMNFPEGLSVDADIWSVNGVSTLEFPVIRSGWSSKEGGEPVSHLLGRVGEGGELLRIFSKAGHISILKRKVD